MENGMCSLLSPHSFLPPRLLEVVYTHIHCFHCAAAAVPRFSDCSALLSRQMLRLALQALLRYAVTRWLSRQALPAGSLAGGWLPLAASVVGTQRPQPFQRPRKTSLAGFAIVLAGLHPRRRQRDPSRGTDRQHAAAGPHGGRAA